MGIKRRTLEAKKPVLSAEGTSTAQSPWGQSYTFFFSLRYAPESEVNSNCRPWLTEDLFEEGREPTAKNHANFCPGAKE